MRHLRVIQLFAALVGLSLAGSLSVLAASPNQMKLESERRYVPAENQGQKGFWIEYEEYTYKYLPWPEALTQLYKALFNVDISVKALDSLVQRIHRKEMTVDQGLDAIRSLHQALSADKNLYDIRYMSGDGPRNYGMLTMEKQAIEFDLIDKYFGKVWKGKYNDKREAMKVEFNNGSYYKSGVGPITASLFSEVSRHARILESMDLGIPIPATTLKGEYMLKKGLYDAQGQPYSMAITRDNLLAKMKELYAVAIDLDPNLTRPQRESYDNSNLGAMNIPLHPTPLH